ncbi:hypothetical protein [Novosphingobium album (ex Hu et al. 2023)]|uniref:Energy transducer TonB n=1 Tax=Novosphingobium album (ex Hu et al. 2023) TaxID=2930093 RepID=A0ABT0B3C6_9SPHN|nr:hypothetical protein [Novosphingobium album (ex Hu et al. 2023)]MCJ2179409.1 hypothetical protein [Novosphingobium album (ex Hu et al. 2023)]
MRSDSDRVTVGYQPGSPRQRLVSTLLSAAIIVLALLVAIYQTQVAPRLEKQKNPVTFDVSGNNEDAGSKARDKKRQEKKREPREAVQEAVQVKTPVPPVEQPAPAQKPAFTFLKLSSADMAAADIGGMRSSGDSAPSGGGAVYGPGEGPGGAILYNADWYRKPTDAQLGGYLPATAPREGWGMIACQTLEHYKVDNCQILGESPRGSGFGRAVLNAAWQFQVVPPRINGKPQLGTWVRIRIDYGVKGSAAG